MIRVKEVKKTKQSKSHLQRRPTKEEMKITIESDEEENEEEEGDNEGEEGEEGEGEEGDNEEVRRR